MSPFSGRTAAIALTAVFGVAVAATAIHDPKPAEEAAEEMHVCVDNILIPQTIEQADFLTQHAAEAYAALDQRHDPKDSPLLDAQIASYEKQGKTVTMTGFDPNGASSTLPDGTKRPVGCYTLSIQ